MHISVYNSLEDKTSANVERINKLLRNSYIECNDYFDNITEVHYNGEDLQGIINNQGKLNWYVSRNYSNIVSEYTISLQMLRTVFVNLSYLKGILKFTSFNGVEVITQKPTIYDTYVSRDIMFEKVSKGMGELNYLVSLMYGKVMYGDYILRYIPNNKYISSSSVLCNILSKYTSDVTTELETYKIPREYKFRRQIDFNVKKSDNIYFISSKRFSAKVKYIPPQEGNIISVLVEDYGNMSKPDIIEHLPLYSILSNTILSKEKI